MSEKTADIRNRREWVGDHINTRSVDAKRSGVKMTINVGEIVLRLVILYVGRFDGNTDRSFRKNRIIVYTLSGISF